MIITTPKFRRSKLKLILFYLTIYLGPIQAKSKTSKASKSSQNLKYILLWTQMTTTDRSYYFGNGREPFRNCSKNNCYVTGNRTFFKDLTKFDMIAFSGRSISRADLPRKRSPHQKYVYMNRESSDYMPVCFSEFDSFYNWTATYKLDSDIPSPYILIRDAAGKIVGPKKNMVWADEYPDLSLEMEVKLSGKTKAAAWFVSHCKARSNRMKFVISLQKELDAYGHKIDIYGNCGTLKCPRDQHAACGKMLEKDYFFYLSFENSFAEDYVTEKLLNALDNNVVPIVFGGADYDRFLPPGSYLNARTMSVSSLAETMNKLITKPYLYQEFFKWKAYYKYSDPSLKENICNICEALNNKRKVKTYAYYSNFRQWWNPNYFKRCFFFLSHIAKKALQML